MAMVVNHNATSMQALGNLNKTQRGLSESFAKISSGLRINNAADDSAGLAVAENLEAEQMSLRQAQRNTHDGISVIQTAEGATNEVGDILKRMRELAVQSSSETLHNDGGLIFRMNLNSSPVKWTASQTSQNSTEFHSKYSGNTINVQVGIHDSSDDRIGIGRDIRAATLKVDTGNVSMSTAASAQAALTDRQCTRHGRGYRSDYGAVQNRLESALNNLETYTENVAGAESRIRDADFAHET